MNKKLEEILLKVDKPARYIGNEVNVVKKDLNDIDVRFLLAFPDVYEIGMSHLGMELLYFYLNERKDTFCERVYSPWVDMAKIMKEKNIELFSLETTTPAKEFDFIGITLQYEMSYTNIVAMLDMSNIEIFSKNRKEEDPLIIAGGPCAYNPEPLADIIDIFYLGEGEVQLYEILDLYKEHKKNNGTKEEFLKKIVKLQGIYVPKFYDVSYNEDGTIKSFDKNYSEAPDTVSKVIVKDLPNSYYPEKQLVPLIEIVHDRVTLEVFRGCIRGCRFCQAGYIYRPVRERSSDNIIESGKTLLENTGHEEVSLVSLSTSDYTDFEKVATKLNEIENVNISLPSLRIDEVSIDIMKKIQEMRKSSLTFAPEAGSQRMRDVINKGLTEEEILNGSSLAFNGGWNRVKLYFMVGLPTEQQEDILGIVKLGESIVEKYYEMPKEKRNKPVNIVLSTSCFVPKPFTAFQWEKQDDYDSFMEKQRLIKKSIKSKQIKYNYHHANLSILEGVVARGDRRISKVIVKAYELGAKFDGWTEFFDREIWDEAFELCNITKEFYTRERSVEEVLPWDFIDIGITKDYFIKEKNKAYAVEVTPNCREKCSGCGLTRGKDGVCHV